MDVGNGLRQARQRRGMTLEDVASSTKIPRQTLDRIERNEFEALPGGILTRGYLRAYAALVGLDPALVVRDYLAQRFGAAGEELRIVPPPPVEAETHPARRFAVELVVIALAATAWQVYRSARTPSEPRRAAAPIAVAPEMPASSEIVVPASLAAEAGQAPRVHVEIRPSGPCWVSATADGQLVIHRLMQDGDVSVASADEALVIRVGDPATFVYWVNGEPGRLVGPAGRPRTMRITGETYRAFLIDDSAKPAALIAGST